MEHIPDPKIFVRKIINSLTIDGRFVLEVPSIDDPLLSIYKIKEFNRFYWYPYHLYFYNKQTLKNLFAQFGEINYHIKLSQRYGIRNHLSWLIKRKPGSNNKKIPVLDGIYMFLLTKVLNVSDTIIVHGEKK